MEPEEEEWRRLRYEYGERIVSLEEWMWQRHLAHRATMIPKQRREVQAASVEDPKDGETTQKEQERVIAQDEEPTRKCKR
jgi:hypothetical protein